MNHPIKLTIAAVAALATSIAAAPPSEARDAWDTTRVHVTRHVSPVPKVVDLRVGEHPRFDRVVIDLRGKRTGYTVGYVRRLTYDGSGEQVPLRGRRFVSVRLTPTVAHNQSGASVYSGPRLRQYHLPSLCGVAFTGDFESHVSFGLALRQREDFRVFVLRKPNRIVIDLHH